jgi:hypothetical protein
VEALRRTKTLTAAEFVEISTTKSPSLELADHIEDVFSAQLAALPSGGDCCGVSAWGLTYSPAASQDASRPQVQPKHTASLATT